MDFMRLFLGACTVLIATTLGAAGVLAFKSIPEGEVRNKMIEQGRRSVTLSQAQP